MENEPITLFTDDERKQLNTIAMDKFSVGAFSGMIYNAKLAHPTISIDALIKLSLDVRNRIIELGKGFTYENNVVTEKLPSGTMITVNKFKKVIKQ